MGGKRRVASVSPAQRLQDQVGAHGVPVVLARRFAEGGKGADGWAVGLF